MADGAVLAHERAHVLPIGGIGGCGRRANHRGTEAQRRKEDGFHFAQKQLMPFYFND
jgi:hypothetical protein